MLKLIFIIVLVLSGVSPASSSQPKETCRQFLDSADHYYRNNDIDAALRYYSAFIDNSPLAECDEHPAEMFYAHNRVGIIYMNMGNYHRAYKSLLDALLLCEKYGMKPEEARIYNNLGNIYYHFKKYDVAKDYYYKALSLCDDSVSSGFYNNLGMALSQTGETDSAFYYFDKSLQSCRQYDNDRLFALYNSMAQTYQRKQQCDSAFHYYRLSSYESRKNNKIEHEASNLSDLSKLFLEVGQIDSSLYYVGRSNRLAEENNFLKVMVENNLVMSQIEDMRGNTKSAFGYYKRYAALRDSVFNASVFGDIGQLQRSYENTKTRQQIDRLVVEKKQKERTIWVTVSILILMIAVSGYIYLQNKKLNKAYRALVEKDLEVRKYQEKEKKMEGGGYGTHDELFDSILTVMEDTELICDPDFSIDKLATAVKSNHTYVSRAIKNATDKPFRSFLNAYRIREAQRIFAEADMSRYTIESIALRVGFKSRNTFHNVFKDVIGVSPNFYLKSMQERLKTS